jgi:alpha-tubulin suppressor-like RCC1 family protein
MKYVNGKSKIFLVTLMAFSAMLHGCLFADDALELSNQPSAGPKIAVESSSSVSPKLTESPTINWTLNSSLSKYVARYEVCLGTAAGLCDVVSWQNVGLQDSHKFENCILNPAKDYYVDVRYVDNRTNVLSSHYGLGKFRSANQIKQLVSGGFHSCALSEEGTVKCWGANAWGQLGYDNNFHKGIVSGDMTDLPNINLGVGRTAQSLVVGYNSTCALLDDGTVKCWGQNTYGQLGQDDVVNRGDTVGSMILLNSINLGSKAKALYGGGHSVCAVLENDTVKCWGANSYGQLGQNDVLHRGDVNGSMASLSPINLGAQTIKKMSVGYYHTCAIFDDDNLKCWGRNNYGQLGYDDTTTRGSTVGSMAALTYVNLGSGRKAKDISVGLYHTCAYLDNDTLKCWGYNYYRQLGYTDDLNRGSTGGSMASLAALNIGSGLKVRKLSSGYYHTCIILDDDSSKCWGYNFSGQLGVDGIYEGFPESTFPPEIYAMTAVKFGAGRHPLDLTAGNNFNCSILDDYSVKCWGTNEYGQLGYEDTFLRGASALPMQDLAPIDFGGANLDVVSMEPGDSHTCAIFSDSTVKCWGDNTYGQLGYDDLVSRGNMTGSMASLQTVNLGVGRTAKMLATGHFHTCALLDNDTVKCWGQNNAGQLGAGVTDTLGDGVGEMAALAPVNLNQTAKYIAAGLHRSCAILSDDTLKCWGRNGYGELGIDTTSNMGTTPAEMTLLPIVNVGAGRKVKSVGLGNFHSCAILDDDTVKCWGSNTYGQLGYDDTTTRGTTVGSMAALQTVNLGSGRKAKKLAVGLYHTCAILDDDTLKCWGYGSFGILGYSDTANRGNTAGSMAALPTVNVGAGRYAKNISAGIYHTCAILDDDTAKCWGRNAPGGSLGYDDSRGTVNTNTLGGPVSLPAINLGLGRTVKDLVATNRHTCVILDNNKMKCWGQNTNGSLGYDDIKRRSGGYSIERVEEQKYKP